MSRPAALAVYDFDGTMIRGDSIVAYLRYAHARRRMGFPALLRAGWAGLVSRMGVLSAGEAKRRALSFRDRLTEEERCALDTAFAITLRDSIRPAALRQMAQDHAAGRKIVLLSASTDNYMLPLAALLKVDALICTPAGLLPEGNCRGAEKVRRLEAWLAEKGLTPDRPTTVAYGDSRSDAPVRARAGTAYLVNPRRRVRRKLSYPCLHWPEKETP